MSSVFDECARVHQLISNLLAHLRRWRDRKLIATSFVEFKGKTAPSVKKGFKTV